MTWSHVTHAQLRRLMALLTVVAAFAFQLRVGGAADLLRADPLVVHGLTPSGHGQAAPAPAAAQPHHREARGQGHSRHSSGPHISNHQGQGNQESHNHAAHCPFCVTGAFALEAGVLPMPTAPPRLAAQARRFAPPHLPAAVRHADARAPPFLL